MKRKSIKIILLILMVIFPILHFYFFTHLYSHDEIWIYGFGANIVDGLIPYRDFNMVITPFFPYLLSVILSVFGKKLIIYHIVIAVMITLITWLAFKKIKWYSVLIYVALLIFSINGYNTSTLLWLFLLLTILDKDDKYQDILIPIIVGIMILTKQTMGLLIIPSLVYSRNKIKTLSVYFVMFLLFMLYLLMNNNVGQFFDYCVFGMFDFASNNGSVSLMFLILEIIMCVLLLNLFIKSGCKRKDVFYVLLYQVMAIPILEIYHFVLGWSAFVYVLFSEDNIKDFIKNTLFISLIIIEILFVFTTNEMFTIRDKQYFDLYSKEGSFMYGRMIHNITEDYIDEMNRIVNSYPEHELYIFGNYSYIVKLELGIPINKFDLINNGNMGYKGETNYIKEIDDVCSLNKCLFIVDDRELLREDYSQVNKKILNYVVNNYSKVYSSNVFGVYVN